jgi:hypothetical protein
MWTRNLKLFIVFVTIVTIGFYYGMLSFSIGHHRLWMNVLGIFYGVTMFSLGWYFGSRDTAAQRFLGLGYHLATYVIFNSIPLLWMSLRSANDAIVWGILNWQLNLMFWWGIFGIGTHLFILWNARRRMIRGMQREEIFE